MNDEVKFIFKTLIKVPVIIIISYLIFNIVMFINFYFRGLGTSYLIMQEVAINNYIPATDRGSITEIARTFENYDKEASFDNETNKSITSDLIDAVVIGVNNEGSFQTNEQIQDTIRAKAPSGNTHSDNLSFIYNGALADDDAIGRKVQYGTPIQCYFAYNFVFQMPLTHGVSGLEGSTEDDGNENYITAADKAHTSNLENNSNGGFRTVVVFAYKVPALKYYPDIK